MGHDVVKVFQVPENLVLLDSIPMCYERDFRFYIIRFHTVPGF